MYIWRPESARCLFFPIEHKIIVIFFFYSESLAILPFTNNRSLMNTHDVDDYMNFVVIDDDGSIVITNK